MGCVDRGRFAHPRIPSSLAAKWPSAPAARSPTLVNRGEGISTDPLWREFPRSGITAGASAPEVLVEGKINRCFSRSITLSPSRTVTTTERRRVLFPLPARIARRGWRSEPGGYITEVPEDRASFAFVAAITRSAIVARLQGYAKGVENTELLSPHIAGRISFLTLYEKPRCAEDELPFLFSNSDGAPRPARPEIPPAPATRATGENSGGICDRAARRSFTFLEGLAPSAGPTQPIAIRSGPRSRR